MIISYCIPCHNRAHDLKIVMPSLIEAANFSPPVEIMILDYNSPDDLARYMEDLMATVEFVDGSTLSYKKYEGASYFSVAHARNLSVLASVGKFLIISCADHILDKEYFKAIRELLSGGDCIWLHPHRRGGGILGCDRKEFIAAGGYDERFYLYGKEDKDIMLRLMRRGGKFKRVPLDMVIDIPTPKADKYKNLRPGLSRVRIEKYSKAIYDENIANEVLVANKGGWGQWE